MDSREEILSSTLRTPMTVHLNVPQIQLNLFILDQDTLIFSSLYNLYNCVQLDLVCNKGAVNKGCGTHTESRGYQHVFVILQETLSTLPEIVYAITTVINRSIPLASVRKKGTLAVLLHNCVLSELAGYVLGD